MKCEESKKEIQEIKERFKPNRGRYIILLIVFIVLTGTCFTISQDNTWFAIIAGLGSGGFSSTLIAWLIAEAESQKALEQTNENREILLSKLSSAFKYGLQILIYYIEKYFNYETPRKWYEWINCGYQVAVDDKDFCHDYLVLIQRFIEDIQDQLYVLEAQSALMLEYGIINSSDIESLSLMLTICDLIKSELFSNKGEDKIVETVNNHFNLLRAAIDYSSSMKFINDIAIEPTIINMSKRVTDSK